MNGQPLAALAWTRLLHRNNPGLPGVVATPYWLWPSHRLISPHMNVLQVQSPHTLHVRLARYQLTWLRNMTRSWMVFDSWEGCSLKSSRLARKCWYCCRNCDAKGWKRERKRGPGQGSNAHICLLIVSLLATVWSWTVTTTQNVSLEETDRLGKRCDAIRHHTLTNLVLVRCWVSFDQVLQLWQIMRELVSVSSRHFVDSHTWALPLA